MEKQKIVLDIIMLLLVAGSIVVSIKSCRIAEDAQKAAQKATEVSENSNQIAREAFETSNYQFVQINRPYIIISPKKYENGQFWKVNQQGKAVVIDLQYETKNVGNINAKNVSLPEKLVVARRRS